MKNYIKYPQIQNLLREYTPHCIAYS